MHGKGEKEQYYMFHYHTNIEGEKEQYYMFHYHINIRISIQQEQPKTLAQVFLPIILLTFLSGKVMNGGLSSRPLASTFFMIVSYISCSL